MGLAESLARAQPRVEATLLDECVIVSDPEAITDDTFDRDTGEWTRPDDDEVQVYSGACSCRPMSADEASRYSTDDGREQIEVPWRVTVMLDDSTGVTEGCVVRITASTRDETLVGRSFAVRVVLSGSNSLTRKLVCEEYRPTSTVRHDA